MSQYTEEQQALITAHIRGEDTSGWEVLVHDNGEWLAADKWLAGHVVLKPSRYEVRRKSTPKVIDWSKLGKCVPVKVWDEGSNPMIIYPLLSTHYRSGFGAWDHASLDTGLWVFNHDDTCPWPSGCVVEVRFWSGCHGTHPVHSLWWGRGKEDRIIASRFHSLEDGYTFGGES